MINSKIGLGNAIKKWFFFTGMFVITLLMTNGFYLKIFEPLIIPNDWLSRIGAVGLFVMCAYLWIFRTSSMYKVTKSRYGVMIILFFLCINLPTFLIGWAIEQRQPLIYPALVVTRVYAGLLIFFCLALYCNTDRLFLGLHKFIILLGTAWLLFLFFAYFAPDFFGEFYGRSGKDAMMRLNTVRFTPPAGARIAIMYTCFYGVMRFIEFPGIKNLHWLFIYGVGIFDFLFVSILRRHSIALIVVPLFYVFGFMRWSKKIFVYLGLLVVVTILFLSSPAFIDRTTWMVESIMSEAKSRETTSTNIRIKAFNYYYPSLVQSGYIGYGYYPLASTLGNSRSTTSSKYLFRGKKIGYYEGDLGILMAFLMYGFQALIWTAIMYLIIFRDLIKTKSLQPQFRMIKVALLLTFLWPFLSLHTFVWGYFEPFWWGVMIFMVFYLSTKFRIKPFEEDIPAEHLQ